MHISLQAEKLFSIGTWPVTNAVLFSVVTLVLLAAVSLILKWRLALVPGGLQNVCEIALERLLVLMDGILGNRRHSEKYLPIVATIFIFILVSNWLGLFPGVGSVGLYEELHDRGREVSFVPLFRAPAADLNFTIALAIIAILGVNVFGIFAIGAAKHFKKFFNFTNPLLTFTGIFEFISEFVKIISFSFRLFGNVFAGEVLLIIIGFLVPVILPLPFLMLEVFVGFVQAFIFAMLTLVFIALAVTEQEAHS